MPSVEMFFTHLVQTAVIVVIGVNALATRKALPKNTVPCKMSVSFDNQIKLGTV